MTILNTIRKEILSWRSLIFVLCVAVLYILLSGILLSTKLISGIFVANFAIEFKIKFLFFLLTGFWETLSFLDQALLVSDAFLTGLNLLLVYKTISSLNHKGKIRFSIGGATIISLITSGCASCGVSVISILGISSSALSFLPFHGLELHLLATVLLLISFIYMLRQLFVGIYCKIPQRKK